MLKQVLSANTMASKALTISSIDTYDDNGYSYKTIKLSIKSRWLWQQSLPAEIVDVLITVIVQINYSQYFIQHNAQLTYTSPLLRLNQAVSNYQAVNCQ